MEKQKRALRRHHRGRVIRLRIAIARTWGIFFQESEWWQKTGRLAKYNLACGCGLCKKPRYNRAKDANV